jgi:hypothetical protein
MNDNHESSNDKKDRIKATANIPAAGAIVTTAILLSGLSLIGSNQQPVLAQEQQNMTRGGGGAGNATKATMTGTNCSAPVKSSPTANSLTGGTMTGSVATTGVGVGTSGAGGGTSPDAGVSTADDNSSGGTTAYPQKR